MRAGIRTGGRSLGVFFKEGGKEAYARVWAPLAATVEIEITASGDSLPLSQESGGYWCGGPLSLGQGDRYRFIVDGGKPLADPASLFQPEGVHGPSELVDLSRFNWMAADWQNYPLEDYIIYELHTGTFTRGGRFSDVADRLDYLVELGINAIEIMPVAQFPGSRNWGYDGVYPFAVQDSYGGPEGLQSLVDACHQKGIAVILDVVYNHLGPEGAYHSAYGPYFTDKYKTPWGKAVNFDDEWCDGVRDYFVENALMWFRDFRIDALRLDAVHAIKDLSPVHLLEEIRKATDKLMEDTGRKHYLIVESDLNDTRFIDPLEGRGYGMDAQWVDEFHHALRTAVGEPKTGYYADFNGIEHLAKAYADAYVYDGQFSPHRKKSFGVKATGRAGKQFIVFSQNHDQVGNRMLGERTGTLVNFETRKLLAGAVLTSPFLPMLFMGEEWSETAPFQYFVSHTDPELAAAVRKGRKEEFAAFHIEGEAPDPMDEATFQASKLQWDLHKEGTHAQMFRFYQELIRLRKHNAVLRIPDREGLTVETDLERHLITLHRQRLAEKLVVFLNFSEGEVRARSLQDINGTACSLLPILNGAARTPIGPEGISLHCNRNQLRSTQQHMYNPVSTYRIQFHKDFTFRDLQKALPYLQKLGVRTIYASPIFEAVPGSTHGYDGLNPHSINPEIGTEQELYELSKTLKGYGMGWIQDIVPNHMAFDTRNPWLADVLEKGAESRYTNFFDIAWQSSIYEGRLMVPFLGTSVEEALSQGQLPVQYADRRFVFRYFETAYPLHPRSYITICTAKEEAPPGVVQHWLSQVETISTDADVATFAEAWERCLDALALLMREAEVADYIAACLEQVNTSAEALHTLLAQQVYRLCHWQETDGRINYRRFFTVNGLICLNMQDPAVFHEYHKYIFKFVEEGIFQGLRIDHIDGLYDPQAYLHQLRAKAGEGVYIIIEKILEAEENLPDWPVQGTSGYEYLAWVTNLGTNKNSERDFTQFYYSLVEDHKTVGQQVRDKKAAILYQHMGGELDNLFHSFMQMVVPEEYATMRTEDIKTAIAEFLIHCPVYRYYGNNLPLAEGERSLVQEVFHRVRESREDLSGAVRLLESKLLHTDHAQHHDAGAIIHFYKRCMQLAGPLMAKGVEDTLMYTFNRLIVHNEVGDAVDAFGMSADTFHQKMKDRQQAWPLALNASATHDTKRGEDVRARLNVLSHLPAEWIGKVDEWHSMNKVLSTGGAPDPNDEYFIYQTLLGTFPFDEADERYRSRLTEYLQKALREGKRRSNWSQPDLPYEKATADFAAALLDTNAPFWKSFHAILVKVRDHGVINSLVHVILKTTCPGVPDVYQGTEFWDLSFVDPDNRRPVDYEQRLQALEEIEEEQEAVSLFKPLWLDRKSGRIKLWLTRSMLQLRVQYDTVFTRGKYLPLVVSGSCKDHVAAFARIHRGTCIIVAVPVSTAALCSEAEVDIDNLDWKDTAIALPRDATGTWQSLLGSESGDAVGTLNVGTLFRQQPFAILKTAVVQKERGSGLLLHISSLPSKFGIGDLGPEARSFADFLAASSQKYWQVLPINPTEGGQGHSPYSATSSRAGNILLISPEALIGDGLLEADMVQKAELPQTNATDFGAAAHVREVLLEEAWKSFGKGGSDTLQSQFQTFCAAEKEWLEDFALYTLLKGQHDGKPWYEWPEELRGYNTPALEVLKSKNGAALDKIRWLQFIFSRQWQCLKEYCNERGVSLIGDIPFYVSYDSADVWSNQHLFALDDEGQRTGIAGVPPDDFSADGQLWGMPVFKWDVLEETGYKWWVERLKKNSEAFDLVRLDHFRAFAAYWEVPAGEETARNGQWKEGPGKNFFTKLEEELGRIPFVAEDLGEVNDAVFDLRDAFAMPGMKVLQFAFGEDVASSDYIPHNYSPNFFVYPGTHDNNTMLGWYRSDADEGVRQRINRYAAREVTEGEIPHFFCRMAMASVARTAILPVQDLLQLDGSARMNKPASAEGNWGWRLTPGQLNSAALRALTEWTTLYNRD